MSSDVQREMEWMVSVNACVSDLFLCHVPSSDVWNHSVAVTWSIWNREYYIFVSLSSFVVNLGKFRFHSLLSFLGQIPNTVLYTGWSVLIVCLFYYNRTRFPNSAKNVRQRTSTPIAGAYCFRMHISPRYSTWNLAGE